MQLQPFAPKMGDASYAISGVAFNTSNHGVWSDLCSVSDRTWYIGDERRAFRVGGAAIVAEATVNAGRPASVWGAEGCNRSRRDRNTKFETPVNQLACRRVQLVLALRISFSPPAPRVMRRTRDLQRFLDLLVIGLEVFERDRPVTNIGTAHRSIECAALEIL